MSAAAPPPPPATSSDPPPPPPEPLSRGYLSLRQAGAASDDDDHPAPAPAPAPGPPGDSRCRAMMEVVRKDGADADAGGKWKVSKLVLDHNHHLQASASASAFAASVPALGMEFDSVHDAKGFYYGYGDAAGFKPRTGSNRRSAGTGAMIMQRFLCCRGNYSYRRGKSDAAKEVEDGGAVGNEAGISGPSKKRGRKPGKKNTQAIEAEKGVVAAASAENGQGVPGRMDLRRGRGKMVVAVAEKDDDTVGKPLQANGGAADVAQDGAHDTGGNGNAADDNAVEDKTEKVAEVKEKRGRGRPRKAVAEGSGLLGDGAG